MITGNGFLTPVIGFLPALLGGIASIGGLIAKLFAKKDDAQARPAPSPAAPPIASPQAKSGDVAIPMSAMPAGLPSQQNAPMSAPLTGGSGSQLDDPEMRQYLMRGK